MIKENVIKSNRWNYRFNPFLAVIVGILVVSICDHLLILITGYPNNYLIFIVDVAISLIIGAFITIFVSKEKKLRYGIYLAVICVIFGLLSSYFGGSIHTINDIRLISLMSVIIGYLISALIGSYLGILLDNHLKMKNGRKLIIWNKSVLIVLIIITIIGILFVGIQGIILGIITIWYLIKNNRISTQEDEIDQWSLMM